MFLGLEKPKERNINLDAEESPLKKSNGKLKLFRNKFFVALLINQNPQLKKYRKNFKEEGSHIQIKEDNETKSPISQTKKESIFKPRASLKNESENLIAEEEVPKNIEMMEFSKNNFQDKKNPFSLHQIKNHP